MAQEKNLSGCSTATLLFPPLLPQAFFPPLPALCLTLSLMLKKYPCASTVSSAWLQVIHHLLWRRNPYLLGHLSFPGLGMLDQLHLHP